MTGSGTLHFAGDAATRLEAICATSDVVDQRRWTLPRLGLQPGERVIDIGCGPGFLARALAEAVEPTGAVLGIDISDPLLERARQRCADLPWVTLLSGDARSLPAEDAGLDVAVCIQVLEYVDDADRAIGEIARVLRAGGRAVLIDTDWRTLVWHTNEPERMRRVLACWDEHARHPHLPCTLAARLRRAGLVVDGIEIYPLLNPRLHEDTYSHDIIRLIAAFVAGRQGLSEAEAGAWEAELRALGAEDAYFMSLNRYQFAAHRPGAT
jgi:SAM-dependent methyltransferase